MKGSGIKLGLFLVQGILSPIMENQMEKKMENEMETGGYRDFIGFG